MTFTIILRSITNRFSTTINLIIYNYETVKSGKIINLLREK